MSFLTHNDRCVILDTVLLDIPEFPEVYKRLLESCTHTVLFAVNVVCDLETCRRRNIERGDRHENQSQWQYEHLVKIKYDLTVDTTTQSPISCAEIILDSLGRYKSIQTAMF